MYDKAVFLAFTSPCGGVGTSSLAICAGRTLSRLYDKKALFVSFDALSSKCGIEGGADRIDFFKAGTGITNWNVLKDSAVLSDEYGLSYLKSKDTLNPLHRGHSDYEMLLENAAFDYDYVLLDLPFCLIDTIKLLGCCEHIILNYGFAHSSLYKHFNEAEAFITEFFSDSLLHKFVCERDSDFFLDGEIDIHGEYGARVRSLLGELNAAL